MTPGRTSAVRWSLAAATAASVMAVLLTASLATTSGAASALPDTTPTPCTYLPFIAYSPACPTSSTNQYEGGTAYQYDQDDPVRPAWNHADKNIELRGYAANSNPGLRKDLVDYGCDDDKAPQLATLFSPHRVPALVGFYRVNHWDYASSPDPGERADPIANPPVTALGLRTAHGESLYVPDSGYDIGGGKEAIVIYADEDTVALRYAREDTVGGPPRDYVPGNGGPGYVVHVDGICTDPNLLALYDSHDAPGGPRYVYVHPDERPYAYPLPNLASGKPIGVARTDEVVVAVVDTGSFQDPRSLNEFWNVRPGYPGSRSDRAH